MDSSTETPLAMLPLEVLMKINFYLDLQDYVNLQASSTRLRVSLKADDVCRDYVKRCMNLTFETDFAGKGLIDYNTAIRRAYVTKTRFELAKPYSVIVLAHSHEWFYGEGILAYTLGDVIRILDVYNAAVEEDVIDVRLLFREEARRWPQHIHGIGEILSNDLSIRLLDCREGILLFAIQKAWLSTGYLVAVNIRKEVPVQERLLTLCTSSWECEARTDGRYVIVFNRSGNLKLYDLEDEQQGIQERQLPNLKDHGEAVLQIYDGCFYLLTNEHFDPEDDITVDRVTSGGDLYCHRFPFEQSCTITSYCAGGTEPLPEQLQIVRIKRQQPTRRDVPSRVAPRPWWSLNLWSGIDEQLVIGEGWYHGGLESVRESAQYSYQFLDLPEPIFAVDTPVSEKNLFYFGRAVQSLDPADLPGAAKYCECPSDPNDRIKARAYVPKASTSFDVDHGSNETSESGKEFEFRLAAASCNHASSSRFESNQLDKTFAGQTDRLSPDDNKRQEFVGVPRFPPIEVPKTLLDLLWPTTGEKRMGLRSTSDSRSILYQTVHTTRKCTNPAKQMVLINFDPLIRFPGLETMVLRPSLTMLNQYQYKFELERAEPSSGLRFMPVPEEMIRARQDEWEPRLPKMPKDDKAEKVREHKSSWFQTEQAMYLNIRQGFQFA